jgi:hypothetical protein
MFLSSLFLEASSKVGVWIYIGNQKDTPKVLAIGLGITARDGEGFLGFWESGSMSLCQNR